MPGWIIWGVKWGGLVVAIIALLSIFFVEMFAPVPEATTSFSQIMYLGAGLIFALVGTALERRYSKK